MKKHLALLLTAGLGLFPIVAQAADVATAVPQNLTSYLEGLQVKLAHLAQRANQPTADSTEVSGVRGSEQEPLSKQLYWKGKPTSSAPAILEVRGFRSALDLAQVGKTDDAVREIKSFQDKYPKSQLAPDAQELLAKLNQNAPVAPAPVQ